MTPTPPTGPPDAAAEAAAVLAARRLRSHVFGAWTEPAAVRAAGVRARLETPAAALAACTPGADRPDPVGVVDDAHVGRIRDLVATRVGRMAASPFAFLRGTAAVMAADLAGSPSSGVTAWICGDAHAANFGLYASPERRQVMDVNDFDETVRGPWEWDLKRLVASLVVAGREGGVDERRCRVAAVDCARTYRAAMREAAGMHVLDAYYLTTDAKTIDRFDIGHLADVFDRVRKKAKKNTSSKIADRVTQRVERDAWRFVEQPPELTHVDDATAAAVVDAVEDYADGCLDPELRYLLSRFGVADVAHRVVGLGSVGLRSYVVLLHGNGEDALVLQVKEARPSALAPWVEPSGYDHEGERIVRGQRWMQTVSDVLLGWTSVDGRPYLVRQFRDMKGSIDPGALEANQLDDYARVVGAVLARAHAQSVDPRSVSGYVDGTPADARGDGTAGGGEGADGAVGGAGDGSDGEDGVDGGGPAFDAALADFAVAYADRTEADHALLVEAVRAGRLPAAPAD